jgi:RecA-family ATPase
VGPELARRTELTTPPPAWLIEPLIPMGTLTLLGGRDGLGKTLLGLEMIRAVLPPTEAGAGEPFLLNEFRVHSHGPVISLLLDDPESLIAERLDTLGIRDHPDHRLATFDDVEDIARPIPLFNALARQIAETKAVLVVIDALYLFLPADPKGADQAAAMRPFMLLLNKLAEECGVAVLVIAHDRKSGDDFAHSYIIRALAKSALRLAAALDDSEPEDDRDTSPDRYLKLVKSKYAPARAWRVRLHGAGHWQYLGTAREYRQRARQAEQQTSATALVDEVIAVVRNGLTQPSGDRIAQALNRRKADVGGAQGSG